MFLKCVNWQTIQKVPATASDFNCGLRHETETDNNLSRSSAAMSIRVAIVFGAALIATAAPAHADANSYLAYIHNTGINTAGKPDSWLLDNGQHACELLRTGTTVDQISEGTSNADKRGLTLAAQHELCPDTLH
jgi:Protein of unknown function (DUF732)